jgi:hypothetical protein
MARVVFLAPPLVGAVNGRYMAVGRRPSFLPQPESDLFAPNSIVRGYDCLQGRMEGRGRGEKVHKLDSREWSRAISVRPVPVCHFFESQLDPSRSDRALRQQDGRYRGVLGSYKISHAERQWAGPSHFPDFGPIPFLV